MRERQRIVSRSYIPRTEVSFIAMSPPPPTRCSVLQCMRIVMGLCGDTSAQQHGVGHMDKLRSSTFLPPVHNRSLVVYQPPIHEGPWASALGFRRECSTEPVGPGEHPSVGSSGCLPSTEQHSEFHINEYNPLFLTVY